MDHLNLVHHVLQKVMHIDLNSNLYQDLYQCGCYGLVKAQKTYNKKLGPFSTHAYYYVRKEIQKGLYSLGDTISYKSLPGFLNRKSCIPIADYIISIPRSYKNNFESKETFEIQKKFIKELGSDKLIYWIFTPKSKCYIDEQEIKLLLKKYHPDIKMPLNKTKSYLRQVYRSRAISMSKYNKVYNEIFYG